jgi:predicted 3-demethylubiquinone-9 3-methyltransferase (glyoxalase superfamily)
MKRALTIVLLLYLSALSCTNTKPEKSGLAEFEKLKTENDSLKNIIRQNKDNMTKQMIRSLTFQDNNAENAMNFYVELFDNSKIINLQRWGKDGPVEEGRIMQATFELDGNLFMCSDSPPVHDWDFTPAVSNYIECENESELERLFSKLSENGNVTMPLNNYGFSQKFGWVIDQFGVSWQLNLE